ncbi:MAG: cell division protein FtsL [Ignavibacteria bacterium]|nr:cell division protein FtsL [Ignavibacteria bacterium]
MVRQTEGQMEEVLRRAREEEAVERDRRSSEGPRKKRVSELESPVLRLNRRGVQRRVSPLTVILLLFGLATISVLYIGHIITVNHLAVDADNLQAEYDKLVQSGDQLRAEIDRKSARERIVGIATTQLDMRPPNGQARWITVDGTFSPETPEVDE